MFVSSNVEDQEAEALCAKMGIPRTLDLRRYLGHRLVHRGRNRYGYGEVLQRVKDKLDG